MRRRRDKNYIANKSVTSLERVKTDLNSIFISMRKNLYKILVVLHLKEIKN